MTPFLPPPGPATPEPVRAVLQGVHDALRSLLQPGAPTPVFAATSADLPPAAQYPRTVVLVADLDILAHSNGANWIRQDTGGVVA